MRIATWNINSVRLRLDLVLRFLETCQPDILCLQETKVINDLFPARAFQDMGYPHLAICGMKGYNGVATISRLPFQTVATPIWCERDDCRHVAVKLDTGPEIHNFYIPSGGDIPDRDLNPKFGHKLDFIRQLTSWLPQVTGSGTSDIVLVGDLNIAPMENDVWSHKQMLNIVSHTPAEVDALNGLRKAGGMVDAIRHFVPADQKLYSWWSYRSKDWSQSDRGRRLDHIWVSPGMTNRLTRHGVIRDARGWLPKPSDHVPLWIDVAD